MRMAVTRRSAGVVRLQESEQHEHYDLHRQHADEHAPERRHGCTFFSGGGSSPALSAFTKRRTPPGTPPGIWRNSASVVYTYIPFPSGVTSSAPLFGGSPGSCISSGVEKCGSITVGM